MGNSILEQEVFLFSGYKNKKWSTTKVVIGRPQKMLEQTTVEVIAINDHRKCHRGDHTTVIVIMPITLGVGLFFMVASSRIELLSYIPEM